MAQKHKSYPNQISKWKQEFLARAETVFEKETKKEKSESAEKDKLYGSTTNLMVKYQNLF